MHYLRNILDLKSWQERATLSLRVDQVKGCSVLYWDIMLEVNMNKGIVFRKSSNSANTCFWFLSTTKTKMDCKALPNLEAFSRKSSTNPLDFWYFFILEWHYCFL